MLFKWHLDSLLPALYESDIFLLEDKNAQGNLLN